MTFLIGAVLTASVTFILGMTGYALAARKEKREQPANDIDKAIAQWKEILGGSVAELRQTVTEQRDQNDRLVAINAEQRETLERQEQEISELEKDVDRLEMLVRSLTQQNMDIAHEAQRVQHKLDELMAEHHQMLGRMKQRGDDAATG